MSPERIEIAMRGTDAVGAVEVASTDGSLARAARVRLSHSDRPLLRAGEVRVGMLFMTLNPADLLQIDGAYGVKPALPFVPGHEGVGVVLEAASDVRELEPGALVLPLSAGGYWCDERVCPARQLLRLPSGIDPQQAAMAVANPTTARVLLQHMTALQPGDWVLQNAANSAVGQSVRHVAGRMGLNLLNVVRRPDAVPTDVRPNERWIVEPDPAAAQLHERVRERLPEQRPRLALDAIGGLMSGALAACLQDGGTVAVYGLLSGAPAVVDLHHLIFRGVQVRGFWLAGWFAEPANKPLVPQLFSELLAALGEGDLRIAVESIYPLQQFQAALEHAARPARPGKVLLSGAWAERLRFV